MSESTELKNARLNMLGLLRRKKRQTFWSTDMPSDWNPGSVMNCQTGLSFTKLSCWHFIEEKLSEGHPIEIVQLHIPAGKKGYVMNVKSCNDRMIYIKLQISNCLIGRSFHYSYYH